jgi:CHAD domain-containing protein
MELRLELRAAIDPASLRRFRSHPVLKSLIQGKPRNRVETGLTREGHPFRLVRSVYHLGSGAWQADMTIVHGRAEDGQVFCQAGFHLTGGSAEPLCMLLQAMSETASFALIPLDRDAVAGAPPPFVKNSAATLHRGMNAREAFAAIATASTAHLIANHECLRHAGAPEAIHQMRVALRRLRSAMSMFKQMLDTARDWDVLLTDTVAPLRETLGGLAGYEKLCALIAERRQEARGLAMAELSAPRLTRLMLRLSFWIGRAGQESPQATLPVPDLARAVLDKRYRRVRKEMTRFGELTIEGRHQCRIDIKKLRYAADFFSGLYAPKRGQRFLPLLASLQDRLGALNDIAVARDKLEALVMRDGSAELAWAAGQLIGWHAGRSGRLLEQVLTDWTAVEKIPAFWREPI